MVYKVPASKRSIDQNKFEFTVPDDDTVYVVPSVKYLPMGAMEKLQGSADNVTIADILDLFQDKAAQAAVRTLDTEQLQALTVAWQEDSGVGLGESSASSSS